MPVQVKSFSIFFYKAKSFDSGKSLKQICFFVELGRNIDVYA